MNSDFLKNLYNTHTECPSCPALGMVTGFFEDLLGALFPERSEHSFSSLKGFEHHMKTLELQLEKIIKGSFNTNTIDQQTAERFFKNLPDLYKKLEQDSHAMYSGDPAAKSRHEIIRSYPGFYAIAAYRIAHALSLLDIPVVPRLITEYAHGKTGIDIHPGAQIGDYFCIDHGTGVVIGETTVIGDYVKIYQGVTLGALSVRKEDAEVKRHPTIEDNVVVYAGATILGGKTIVGKNSVVGGNVWLTQSVPPKSKVYYQAKMNNGDSEELDLIVFK